VIPAYWYSPVVSALWQVVLHSLVATLIFTVWARRWRLSSGRARRRMLALILLLPLLTALVPGRGGFDFREQMAWLDSSRLLALPLVAGLHLYHGVLALVAVTVLVSLGQEVMPTLRRGCSRRHLERPPEAVERRVRALPHWRRCRVDVCREPGLHISTSGWPGRPRLVLSHEALALPDAELEVALRHENAHWRDGRWWFIHGLFAARLIQIFNPVALWAFREYTVEHEIACDADAVGRGEYCEGPIVDPRPLARVLLRLYEDGESHGRAGRSILRRRIDVLLGRLPQPAEEPPPSAVWTAAGLLLVTLPWMV